MTMAPRTSRHSPWLPPWTPKIALPRSHLERSPTNASVQPWYPEYVETRSKPGEASRAQHEDVKKISACAAFLFVATLVDTIYRTPDGRHVAQLVCGFQTSPMAEDWHLGFMLPFRAMSPAGETEGTWRSAVGAASVPLSGLAGERTEDRRSTADPGPQARQGSSTQSVRRRYR
jgi:hypothetical protein